MNHHGSDLGADSEASQAEIGRRFLTVAVACLLLTSLAVSAFMLSTVGLHRLPQHIVRTALLLLLGYFLLRGRQWARWLLLALLAAALWIALPAIVRADAYSGPNLPGTLALLAMYVGYAVIARGLLWSGSVKAFFRVRNRVQDLGAGSADGSHTG